MELRSRALLIANLAKGTHFKSVTPNPDDLQAKNDLEAAANVTAFVKLVDLAQGIAEVLLLLKQLGHFLYQKQVSRVDLGTGGVHSIPFNFVYIAYCFCLSCHSNLYMFIRGWTRYNVCTTSYKSN